MSRDRRLRRSRAARVRQIILAISLVVALGGLGAIFLRPERWAIEHVEFVWEGDGAHRASVAALRHLADVPEGTPMWRVYTPGVQRAVASHPWVRGAEVERVGPRTLRITVDEHEPVALLRAGRDLVYVDEHGTAFARAPVPAAPEDVDLPYLTGFDALAFSPAQPGAAPLAYNHPELQGAAIRGAIDLIARLDARALVSRREVSEITFVPTSGYTVYAGPSRLLFAPERFAEQVERLASLVAQGVDLHAPTEIDLGPSTVAVVRPIRPPAPATGE
jgi:POTRA domain, FtsQ-type/Cell division protein FtsQ